MSETRTLALTEENLPALMDLELKQALEGIDYRPTRIKVEHRSKVFLSPDGLATKTLNVIVVFSHKARGYWANEGDKAPACASMDGRSGLARPDSDLDWAASGNPNPCATCPLNQFGTDIKGGQGKACKEMRRLFVLETDNKGNPVAILPAILSIPPTSLKPWDEYVSGLVRKRQVPIQRITCLRLEGAQGGAFEYAKVVAEPGETLPNDLVLQMMAMRDQVIKSAAKIGIESEDYGAGVDESAGGDWVPPPDADVPF